MCGASDVIDREVEDSMGRESLIDGVTSHRSFEDDDVNQAASSNAILRSEGMVPLFMEHDL